MPSVDRPFADPAATVAGPDKVVVVNVSEDRDLKDAVQVRWICFSLYWARNAGHTVFRGS